jgi:hypothetical protein
MKYIQFQQSANPYSLLNELFFPRENAMTLRFFSLQEEEFVTDTSLQGGLQLIITTDQ